MKAYLITSGMVFGLLTLAHVWRIIEEGMHAATNPWFVLTTVIVASLNLWAWRLFRISSHS
jgi:hypothetical protein